MTPGYIYFPRYRAGYVQKLSRKWKFGMSAGYGNYDISISDFAGDFEEGYRLWEIRPHLYYILNPERKAENYISVELFYINHKDLFGHGHYFPLNGYSQSYDQAHFLRQKFGLNVVHGFFFHSKWRIGVNGYVGFGIKVRKNTFQEVTNSQDVDLGPEAGDMFGLFNYKNVEGVKVGVNPLLGIKLYYKIYE